MVFITNNTSKSKRNRIIKAIIIHRNHNYDKIMDPYIKDILIKLFIVGKMENVVDQTDIFV